MSKRTARTTWVVVGSVVAALILLTSGLWAVNALARTTETVTQVFDDPQVGVLDVDVANGSVNVVAVSGEPITVTAEITHGLQQSEQQVGVEGERLVIRESCRGGPLAFFCQADYTITAPPDIAADLRSGNGSILMSGIDGPIDASSSNGSVAATGISGDLRLRSSNGRVEASGLTSDVVAASSTNGSVDLAFVEPPRDVDAESSNGAVEVVVPDDGTAYRVDGASDNGSVDTPVRTDPSSERTIVAESRNGSVTVRSSGR